MQNREILILADTIQGEINRMCVTSDIAELDSMALHAVKNIRKLQSMRYNDIIAQSPQTGILFEDRDGDVWEWRGDAWYCISDDGERIEE